jgi:CHAD domain-containing protein
LSRRQRANTALRRVLADLFTRLTANGEGVRHDSHPEILHQFRVGIRRTRSLLDDIRDVFDPETVAGFQRDFRWLGRLTGPVRDLDVLTNKLGRYARKLPEPERRALAAVHAAIAARRSAARESLLAALGSERYAVLTAHWPLFLSKPPPKLGALGEATLASAVTPAIEHLHRRVLKRGRKLEPASTDNVVHRVRIDCKRLRYLLEQSASLYPEAPASRLLGELRKLQEVLGNFNDCRVHRDLLEREVATLGVQPVEADAARAAVDRILADLDRRAARQRKRAVERLAALASPKGRRLFAEMVRG